MGNKNRRRDGNPKGEQSNVTGTQTVHPYTFIPLKKRTLQLGGAEASKSKRLTGFIDCTLTMRTQVAVPDLQDQNDTYPFFRIGKTLAIPGSTLRGCIRSVYEALTDSCVRTTSERYHYRSNDAKTPGLLAHENNRYVLYEAKRYRVDARANKGYSTQPEAGARVNFTSRTASNAADWAILETDGHQRGYYLEPNSFGSGNKKSHPSVFQKLNRKPQPVSQASIDCLDDNIALYDLIQSGEGKGNQKAIGEAYREAFEKMKRGDGFLLPVWYEYGGTQDCYEFAPSQMSRSVLNLTPLDFLKRLDLEPCNSKDRCCPACRLFGFVGKGASGTIAKASRVRFGDAICTDAPKTIRIKLPPLMKPNISSFEFYLRNDRNTHGFRADDSDTTLSGRKMYWHHQNGFSESQYTGDRDDLLATVEEVPARTRFMFRIYFDKVSAEELNNLVYALNLGETWSNDTQYCLKIGRGKPFGLGSAHVTVNEVTVRTLSGGVYRLNQDEQWKQPLETIEGRLSNVAIIKRVMAFDTVPAEECIVYPNNKGDSLAWFSNNHPIGKPYKEVIEVDGNYGYRAQDSNEPSISIQKEIASRPKVHSFGEDPSGKGQDSRLAGKGLEILLQQLKQQGR